MAEQTRMQFWRGLETNRSGVTPAVGVPIWVTDTKKLYVGDGTTAGGIAITPTQQLIREGHTWAVGGEIKVPSGDTDFIVPFFVFKESNETIQLTRARYKINSGTSVTAKLQKNAVDITGFTGISVTTTAATTAPTAVTLADLDLIALVVTAVSGTPKNMSFSVEIERTRAF